MTESIIRTSLPRDALRRWTNRALAMLHLGASGYPATIVSVARAGAERLLGRVALDEREAVGAGGQLPLAEAAGERERDLPLVLIAAVCVQTFL